MPKKNKGKNENTKRDYRADYEDYYDIRNSTKKPSKNRRKKDKKYLSDMMRGDIDIEDYHDYNNS